jgi:plastocyanin
MRRLMACLVASLVLFGASACGEDDEPATDSVGTETERPDDQVEATEPMELSITAKDYSFDVPATIKAGLLDVTFTNAGKEPHFAGFAKAAPGKTFADVKAALTAPPSASPPSGPPPFIEHAGAPTADPGTGGKMMFSLEAGSYALFCLIPSPDGAPHAVKGMITEVTVTADGGESQAKAELPEAIGTVTATERDAEDEGGDERREASQRREAAPRDQPRRAAAGQEGRRRGGLVPPAGRAATPPLTVGSGGQARRRGNG